MPSLKTCTILRLFLLMKVLLQVLSSRISGHIDGWVSFQEFIVCRGMNNKFVRCVSCLLRHMR